MQRSRYTPLWERIKKDGKATITCNPEHFKRVIKAVQKRKNLDLGYKIQLGERGKVAVVVATPDPLIPNRLHFKLTFNLTAEDF